MRPDTAALLVKINQQFYSRFGESFSATRRRIQPGVRRVMQAFRGDESILDLGCGNGEFARELAKRGHSGAYLGVDFSLPLLRDAETQPEGFSARFREVDLIHLSSDPSLIESGKWDVVTAFAVLHHIPSQELRLSILQTVHDLLNDDGVFIHSNWQFLNSEKLKARIKPWEEASIQRSDVDAGDHLLDWRSGGEGLRYAHYFTESELSALAKATRFKITDVFYSDGESGDLGLYQVWKKDL